MQEIKLKPTIWKPLFSLVSGLGFVALGFYLIFEKGNNFGWFTVVLFGLIVILSLLQFIPNSSYLIINDKGLKIKTLFRTSELSWDDIDNFYTKKVFFQKFVMVKFSPNFQGKFLGVAVEKQLTNRENALPENYGKSTEELSNLLNEEKKKHTFYEMKL
jgi:hypothetical protein